MQQQEQKPGVLVSSETAQLKELLEEWGLQFYYVKLNFSVLRCYSLVIFLQRLSHKQSPKTGPNFALVTLRKSMMFAWM